MVILAVLFSSFAFLANAQLFVPNGTVGNSGNTSIGIRTSGSQYPFHVWDGGTNIWTGIGIDPGNNPTEIGKLFAYKNPGFLLFAGGQDSGRGQSGIFLGSSLGGQRITQLSQSFHFNVVDYTTFLNGTAQGTNIVRIDDTYNSVTYAPEGPHLRVLGGIKAQKVTVTQNVWADYVFADDFKLRPLAEVATFIGKNKHLPDVPSQSEITTNGLDLGEMQKIHMQKIEELTLYLLEQEKRIQELERKLLEISKKK